MFKPALLTLVAVALLADPLPASAEPICGEGPETLIVLDRSGSMSGSSGNVGSKWNKAKQAVDDLTATFGNALAFGLALFPQGGSCGAGNVVVPPGLGTAQAITSAMNSTFPGGNTPISTTLDNVRSYLAQHKGTRPQVVVLITDGIQNCGVTYQATVTAAAALKQDGVDTYVVGFGGGVDPAALEAVAQAGGTQQYYQAHDATQLNAALQAIGTQISCCGNGVLDAGEICDTAIASGPGACPTDCDDNDACTTDQLDGSACAVSCSHQPVTDPVDGDGCCPPGATHLTDDDCADPCGNGVLDPGEACDTAIAPGAPGACPTSCDDNDSCTDDQLVGSACSVRCESSPVLLPQHGDGCCPPGASHAQDHDCPLPCGNGQLDAGEACDPAIAPGAPGACPTSCDDGNSCTTDALLGSGCDVHCASTPVTVAQDGDGCCPPGASYVTDDDCPHPCGNGVLDAGERCDTAIAAGASGACPTSCESADPCEVGRVEGSGCDQRCAFDAAPPQIEGSDGCCPQGLASNADPDCPPPCGPDRREGCVDLCQGVSCADGEYCSFGSCEPWPADTTGAEQPAASGGEGLRLDGGCSVGAGDGAASGAALLLTLLVLVGLRRRRR